MFILSKFPNALLFKNMEGIGLSPAWWNWETNNTCEIWCASLSPYVSLYATVHTRIKFTVYIVPFFFLEKKPWNLEFSHKFPCAIKNKSPLFLWNVKTMVFQYYCDNICVLLSLLLYCVCLEVHYILLCSDCVHCWERSS